MGESNQAQSDIPFERDMPFDDPDLEQKVAAEVIKNELDGFELYVGSRQSRPRRGDAAATSPTLEELQRAYQPDAPPRNWPERRSERYRLYRVYPVRMVDAPSRTPIIRHVVIVYSHDNSGEVVGHIHSYEA